MAAGRMRSALLASTFAATACVSAAATADAASPKWDGRYSLVTYASEKLGTSVAALQSEPDFSAQYVLSTSCSGATCVATVVDGPAPSNPSIPQPLRYTWDGSRWAMSYEWQWECYRGEGMPKEYSPAISRVFYAPNNDGTLYGTWRTDIYSGTCRGYVTMPVAAYPA